MPGRSLWRKRDNVAKLPSGTSAGRPAVLAGSLCLRTLFHWPLIPPPAPLPLTCSRQTVGLSLPLGGRWQPEGLTDEGNSG